MGMCIMSRVKLCKGALHKMAKYGTNVGEYIGTSDDGTVLLLVKGYEIKLGEKQFNKDWEEVSG